MVIVNIGKRINKRAADDVSEALLKHAFANSLAYLPDFETDWKAVWELIKAANIDTKRMMDLSWIQRTTFSLAKYYKVKYYQAGNKVRFELNDLIKEMAIENLTIVDLIDTDLKTFLARQKKIKTFTDKYTLNSSSITQTLPATIQSATASTPRISILLPAKKKFDPSCHSGQNL